MRINNNMMAMNAHRALNLNSLSQTKSLEKLSSGLRINRAADDAAGLSISEKMRGQIRGLQQAVRNAQDGISFLQTAEGAMDEVSNMLVRMKELTIQKASGTYNTDDIENIELELKQLNEQIADIIKNTKFNEKNIDKGIDVCVTDNGATVTRIGLNPAKVTATTDYSAPSQDTTIKINGEDINIAADSDIDAAIDAINAKTADTGVKAIKDGNKIALISEDDIEITDGLGAGFADGITEAEKISTKSGIKELIEETDVTKITTQMVEAAVKAINNVRSTFGAQQNRLESVVNNLNSTVENLQAAESRIRDTDMASEMAEFNKYNILLQASTAMLAQANAVPQAILQLLR